MRYFRAHLRYMTVANNLRESLCDKLGFTDTEAASRLEILLQQIECSLEYTGLLFKELWADLIASKLAGAKAYAANMVRTNERFADTSQELLDLRMKILIAIGNTRTGIQDEKLLHELKTYVPLIEVCSGLFLPYEQTFEAIQSRLGIPQDNRMDITLGKWFEQVLRYTQALDRNAEKV